MIFEFAKMGESLQRPPFPTLHTAVNYITTSPRRAFEPTAVVVTEKDLPDVSFYQGDIDYLVMASKTDTLIIRTGQNRWEDPKFDRNYGLSKANGILRGLYDFYDGRISPGEQADRILSSIGDDRPEMELYIDWERSYGGAHEGLRNVVALMQEIERRQPSIMCGLYTGYYWFRANSNPMTHSSQYAYLRNKPLWLAWYTDNPAEVLIPAPWTHLTLWQYGTPSEDYGQETIEIDKNFYNGTLTEFYDRYGAVEPAPGEPMFFKVISLSSNIRSSAGVVVDPSNDLGADNLLRDDIIETEDSSVLVGTVTWRKLKRWWRGGVERVLPTSPTGQHWAAEKSGTTFYFISTIFTPPPPPSTDYILHYSANGTVRKYVPE